MPSVEAKNAAYEALSDGDLSVTAMQIYQLHLNNPDCKTANVLYKSCAFEIDFTSGNVTQQFVQTGAVKSIIKSETANDYAAQLKQAHSLAAMIEVFEVIKTIKDSRLQSQITDISTKHPAITAGQVLSKLSVDKQTNLSSFGLFGTTNVEAKSPALAAVRKVLADLGSLATLGAADNACKQLTSELQAITRPELKR